MKEIEMLEGTKGSLKNGSFGGCWCLSSWRQACYLILASALISFGLIITVEGLNETLSDDPYASSLLGFSGIGQVWVLGPTLIMVGITILIAAFLLREKNNTKVQNEEKFECFLETRKIDDNAAAARMESDSYIVEEVAPEADAVPMEPMIFLM